MAPVAVQQPPEHVDAVLRALGIGGFVDDGLPAPRGRNTSYAGTTESGQDVFVKVVASSSGAAAADRLGRAMAFQRYFEDGYFAGLHAPNCLGVDEATGVMVFELVRDARSGRDLAGDGEFGEDLAHRLGEAIGALHAAPLPPGTDSSYPPYPPGEALDALPARVFENSSAAALQAWALMQRDEVLLEAVRRLRDRDSSTVLEPAHCDLRLDQVLWHGGELSVIDWEEFRLAEPARDLGALIGEWLHRAVTEIPAAGDPDLPDPALTHEQILAAGAAAIDEFRPWVAACYAGYQAVRGPRDDRFAARCCAFAGWHLLDRMVAAAERLPALGAVERAGAGIGRTILADPDRFTRALGLAA
ncbi:class V lanthionine synthetase subunit LxmK [Amycolatopsis sp. CA-230715]|uniref:class V lanthionine synthetase subunit LxmK n=1 Tax=Amycolatopsis sp. CA-230715 TaxID=2745196 RepID=UPI001C028AFF|nr:class V lanthionine synthetase subunit LxmK [Amycolatopsis sp. CA-230715]QWF82473.1 hypothetical protein HUW46_05910 [Amycolatopsis sp. CA-230715]